MARPKSDDKKNAILTAATKVIATEGLGASTARIAQVAGVASGTLFTYFPTKADLLNQLYLELKSEMAAGAFQGNQPGGDVWARMELLWDRWIRWAVLSPEKRRTLAQLAVSDEISPPTLEKGHRIMAEIAAVVDQSRRAGSLRDAPLALVSDLMAAQADACIDYILRHPDTLETCRATTFGALKRMLS